jgi:hypothetical protein
MFEDAYVLGHSKQELRRLMLQAENLRPITTRLLREAGLMRPAKALGVLALIGLASPFLALSNPMQGIIGLIILFVGIRIAWRMTAARQVNILGPFSEPIPVATRSNMARELCGIAPGIRRMRRLEPMHGSCRNADARDRQQWVRKRALARWRVGEWRRSSYSGPGGLRTVDYNKPNRSALRGRLSLP